MKNYTLRYIGDQALSVEFENEISIKVNQKVRALIHSLEKQKTKISGINELVPTYRTVLIHYNPLEINLENLENLINENVSNLDVSKLPEAFITEIPVLYEGEYAQDLEEIAKIEHKTIEEIIKIHSQSDYYVYMLGFSPGHPYSARFENPFSFKRRNSPRLKIPGGSVVVQLELSDIIPFEQPCGWNIIGTTPVLMCDYRKENPFLLQSGQWIRYVPIKFDEFKEIKRKVELGEYHCRTYKKVV